MEDSQRGSERIYPYPKRLIMNSLLLSHCQQETQDTISIQAWHDGPNEPRQEEPEPKTTKQAVVYATASCHFFHISHTDIINGSS